MAALDFDLACTMRLHQYDIDTAEAQSNHLAYKIIERLGEILPGAEESGNAELV